MIDTIKNISMHAHYQTEKQRKRMHNMPRRVVYAFSFFCQAVYVHANVFDCVMQTSVQDVRATC